MRFIEKVLSVIGVFVALVVVAVVFAFLIPARNAFASGISSVISVFGQTGAVNIPVTTTDIATPSAPAAGHTKWYTKAGALCSLNSSSTETCTNGAAVSFYQTVEQAGTPLAQEAALNFKGAGVSCVDNAGVSTDCTITGGGGGMTLISRQTLGSPASSVTFSSISGGFTDLQMFINSSSSTTGAANDSVLMTFNGDTTANYAIDFNQVVAGSLSGGKLDSQTSMIACQIGTNQFGTNEPGQCTIIINNYAGTTFLKQFTAQAELPEGTPIISAQRALYYIGGVWNSTAAITSITLTSSTGNFVTGSVFELYGIN